MTAARRRRPVVWLSGVRRSGKTTLALAVSLAVKLANPDPYDLTEVDLSEYKGIVAPWNHWHAVQAQCSALAVALLKEAPPAAKKGV